MQSIPATNAKTAGQGTGTIAGLFAVFIFADYLGSISGAGALLKFASAGMLGLLSLYFFGLSLVSAQMPALLVVCYAVACALVSDPSAAQAYEISKVLSFLTMLCGFQYLVRRNRDDVLGYSIGKIADGAVKAIDLCIKFNAIIVLVQLVAGQDVVRYFGIPSEFVNTPQMAGRYSGLILNLPLWSSMLVLQFLLGDRKLFPRHAVSLSRAHKLFLLFLLLLSGQKFAILFTAGYIVLRLGRPALLLALVGGLAYAAYPLVREHPQLVDKMSQVDALLDYGIQLLELADVRSDFPQFGFVDIRVNSWIYGFMSLADAPFGRGLGTWGDFSASLNAAIPDPVVLSESYWSHIMVEQGLLALVFMMIVWLCGRALGNGASRVFFGFMFVSFWFTMGPSDYLWVQLVSLVFFASRLANARVAADGR